MDADKRVYKPGDLVEWLVSGPPAEYAMAVVVSDEGNELKILFRVWGMGPVHQATVEKGRTTGGYRRVFPVSRKLHDWEIRQEAIILEISKLLKGAAAV